MNAMAMFLNRIDWEDKTVIWEDEPLHLKLSKPVKEPGSLCVFGCRKVYGDK